LGERSPALSLDNPDAIVKKSADDSKILKFNKILLKCPDNGNGSRGRSSAINRWFSMNRPKSD
jgi:hypothetical protein